MADDEVLLRITAHYIAEIEAGRQPDLDAYLERYPDYARELLDFVAYYHSVEEDMELDLRGSAPLSEVSIQALERIQKRLLTNDQSSQEGIMLLPRSKKQPAYLQKVEKLKVAENPTTYPPQKEEDMQS